MGSFPDEQAQPEVLPRERRREHGYKPKQKDIRPQSRRKEDDEWGDDWGEDRR